MASSTDKLDRDRMFSTGKVARLLSVTPDTVLKWIKSGQLRARRTAGGHYRVAQRDLDSLMAIVSSRRPGVKTVSCSAGSITPRTVSPVRAVWIAWSTVPVPATATK